MNQPASRMRGFTLVELLVVMSMISVISSVTLVSLNGARYKARNARIVQETNQLRNAFEMGWNGTSYSSLSSAPPVGGDLGTIVSVVEPSNSFSTSISSIVNDILTLNSGSYGGASFSSDSTCGSAITDYMVSSNYTAGMGGGWTSNGLTIFVSPSCGPVTKYAIYAELSPIVKTLSYAPLVEPAYAGVTIPTPPDPATLSGYYCVDSTGHSLISPTGWIPGNVTDAQCH